MAFNPLGLIGGVISGIFGGSKKKEAAAQAAELARQQREKDRIWEERMFALQQAQQKPAGLQISPLVMILGVAVVGMIFIPQIMKR